MSVMDRRMFGACLAAAGTTLALRPASGQSLQPQTQGLRLTELGIDAALEKQLSSVLAEHYPRVRRVGVMRRGQMGLSYYSAGLGPADKLHIASCTKSVLSILVGIALDKGIFRSVEEPAATYLPEIRDNDPTGLARTITLQDMLTMTPGWESRESELTTLEPLDALKRPVIFRPGSTFQYDNSNSHLIGIALARAAGMPLRAFAEAHLFAPLAIKDFEWSIDKYGQAYGSHGLNLTLPDMLSIGQLYLQKGRWRGAEIVSERYVADSLVKRNDGGPPSRQPFGYHWYVLRTPDKKHDAFGAFGFGGQLIYGVPALDLVVAVSQRPDERAANNAFIRELILPAIRD